MVEPVAELLGVVRSHDRVAARLELLLDEHIDKVWTALTAPDWLPKWLAPGHIDLKVGGEAALDFGDSGLAIGSQVTALVPGLLLEYGWSRPGEPARPLRWSLEPVGPQTRLTLALNLPVADDVARSLAGWAAHLDMLVAALAGIPIKFPFDVFQEARAIYRARLAAADTAVGVARPTCGAAAARSSVAGPARRIRGGSSDEDRDLQHQQCQQAPGQPFELAGDRAAGRGVPAGAEERG